MATNPYAAADLNFNYVSAFPSTTPGAVKPVAATAPMNYNPAFGGTPTIPAPTSTAASATAGNLANLPGIFNLAGQTNLFNQGQAVQPYIANLPDYQAMTQTASGNILSNLQGQLPADVMRLIEQSGAERGIATGSPGSPNANAAMLRALGLTSLDLQNLGQTQLTGAIGRTPTAPLFQPQTQFVTPEQEQAASAAQSLYAAAPVPGAAQGANMAALQAGMRAGGGGGAFAPAGFGGLPSSSFNAAVNPFGVGTGTETFSPGAPVGGSLGGTWDESGGWTSPEGYTFTPEEMQLYGPALGIPSGSQYGTTPGTGFTQSTDEFGNVLGAATFDPTAGLLGGDYFE